MCYLTTLSIAKITSYSIGDEWLCRFGGM